MTTTWPQATLTAIDTADDLKISPLRPDAVTFGTPTWIWSVVVDGEHVGTVGVLGPTRMNYPQALATVEVVSERLGKHLGEGAG